MMISRMMMSAVAEMTIVLSPPARPALTSLACAASFSSEGPDRTAAAALARSRSRPADPAIWRTSCPLQHGLNRLSVGVGLADLLIDPGLDLVLADHVTLRLTGQAGSRRADSDHDHGKDSQGESLVHCHDMLLFV